MGITVKNMPKNLEIPEPEPGDVVVDEDGTAWLVTDDQNIVSLESGELLDISSIRVAKTFSNCVLTLA